MKHVSMCAVALALLALQSGAAVAQAYRVTNQTYGSYYADTTVALSFNGGTSTFNNSEYYLSPYEYTSGNNAGSIPLAAQFNVSGAGNPAFGLPTVQMEGYAYTTWGANHARARISGFDPLPASSSTTSCQTAPGSGVCTPGLPETTTTFNTNPNAYTNGLSRWEEIYQTGGASGSLATTYHVQGTLGPQASTSGTPSGNASLFWAERDFNGQNLGYVSASYDAQSDTWSMYTFSNVANTFIPTSGLGTLNINTSIDVQRSYVDGDAIYVDSYLQTSASGNGLSSFENTVTLTKLDFSSGTRIFASSGSNYGAGGLGLLSFAGGTGSGINCSDLSCAAGTGGGGGGGGVIPVPEPAGYALMLAGLAVVAGAMRRGRRADATVATPT